MLEGKTVNLRVVEKEDLPLVSEWMANPDFLGEYIALWQKSRDKYLYSILREEWKEPKILTRNMAQEGD